MSEVNPTPAAEDPPPLVTGESAASDKKNNAEKYGPEESREVAVTSNNAVEVKNGCENGTEGAADVDANIMEADGMNGVDSGCANVIDAEDVKMVDTQHKVNIEAVDVKIVGTQHEANIEAMDVKIADTQHEANIEAEDVKMIDTQHEANIETEDVKMFGTQDVKMFGTQDVKMVHTQHEANTEADEDACQDKEGKNRDNQHTKATEGEDIRMVEAKADARNSEAQDRKEDACQKENHTNIENKDMKMVDEEDECQKEDKGGKNEDCQDAKVAEADEMEIVETKTYVRNAEVQGTGKEEKDKVEEKKNNGNIDDDDLKIVDKEVACQKEDVGNNEDSHDAKVAERDEIKMVVAKTDAGNAEAEENGKKGEEAEKTEDEKNNANIETEELIVLGKDDACQEEDKKVKNRCIKDAKEADGEDMKIVEGKADARIAEVIENRKKGEMEDNAEEKKNDANIDAEDVIMVDKENACQNKDKEGKADDSQDVKAAEGEDIKTVEAKSNAGNAGVKENGKKEEKEEQNEEKANDVNNQADEVKIVDKEDACQKADKERKNEDSHGAKAAEGGEIMAVVAKSAAVHAEVKENGKNEEDGNKTEEKQNANKEESICVEKQDADKMEPSEVDKQEKQDWLKEEEKGGVDKHEVSDREESVKESQEVMKGEEKDNAGRQEVDGREQNVKEKQEELEEEEIVGSIKQGASKDEQDRGAEKQEGEKLDGNVAAETKQEEKQDAKLTAEEKDKIQDGKVAAEKKEEDKVNENVPFEKIAELVIELGVSEKDGKREMNGKTTADKPEGEKKGTKRSNADMEEAENGSASEKEKDGEAAVEEVGELDKNMEDNKDEAPKSKKARIVREENHEKDKKQDSAKSREAKDLLNTPNPSSLDRPVRARKTVERLVEVIEKSGSFTVEKGRGTPLKNIPGVAHRIYRKESADLKFLHQILFGRFGKAAEFKNHILEFSGFVWHESDEKHRAKAKEKLDKCSKDTLFDLCDLLSIPFSRVNSKKEDIVTKLLDFIAEPHANDDSTLSDDQGSNSRKRKREGGSAAKNPEGTRKRSRKKLDDEHASHKRQQKYSELESSEEGHEGDEHMKSDSEENKDDGEEADGEHEDSRKVKASKKSIEGKGSAAKRKEITGSVPKTAPVATLSKCSSRVSSSSKSSKDKQSSAEDSNSRKSKPITPKCMANSQKETNERRSSDSGMNPNGLLSRGKELTISKGKSAEAQKALPSKDELQNTIVEVLKKVNFDTATYSDVLTMLGKPPKSTRQDLHLSILSVLDSNKVNVPDGHYKMDLSSRKEVIKGMVYDELRKRAAAEDSAED
ncbi:hypothetical protein BAE44_0009246 [Dichanthelium oligosanthes]|uniref:DEK C-terminal domain-containing protein n=1 Tax=Dichanthelium oligosanthes TaxID=888268 RepID=A0A1E5VX98_9POAL|nr:hypothetical protein BAE44_0009246 [Dichanthelium oligosanthes]